MGIAKSYEIIEYRKKIMQILCTDTEILKLLGEDKESHPEDTIPYNKVWPHEYIPETITETERMINFELSASLDPKNNVLNDLTIYFFIACHEYVVPYYENGRMFLWYDKAVCALDNILSDRDDVLFGVGKIQCISNKPYYPQQKFKGRQLIFTVKDFTDGLKYGK